VIEHKQLDTNAQLTAILRHLEMQTEEQKRQSAYLKNISTAATIFFVLALIGIGLAFCNALLSV